MSYRDVVILVVEDNPGDAHLIRAMLEETEYATAQLHAVGTLHEAKEANVDHRSVVLVLLDLNLPDSDGIETLLGIKDIYGDSAIIVLTGLEDEKVASQALREGAQNYLVKGTIDAPTLARAMRYALERHGFVMRLRDADRLLAEKELRFRMLVEHATDLNLLVDSAGIVTYTSPSVRRVFGYEQDLTPDVFSLIHRDDLALAYACFETALQRPEEPLPLMVRARTHEGRVIWLEGTVVDLQHVQGVSGVVVNLRDISERVSQEERIAADRRNLDAMINSTSDLVWSVDRELRLIAANEPFVEALQFATGRRLSSGDDLMMLPDAEGVSPTEHWRPLYHRALAGESFKVEEHMTTPAEAHIEINYSPIREGVQVVGVACVSRDVTERRKAQHVLGEAHRHLLASERQKSVILDALPANIAVLDEGGRIIAVNSRWRAFANTNGYFGADRGLGCNYLEVARSSHGPEAEMGGMAAEGLEHVLRGRLPMFSMEYPCDAPTEKRWFRMDVAPLGGIDQGAVVMHTDISERRTMEEQLRHNEATMTTAQAIAHFGSWELNLERPDDPNTGPHSWSDEIYRIVGLERGTVLANLRTFFELVHPEDRDQVRNALETTMRTGIPYSLDHRIVRPDGSVRWLHEEGAVVRGTGGRERVLGTVLDITERKVAEEHVLRLNAELEERVLERTRELEGETVRNRQLSELLLLRNADLMSSITYARRMQDALFPPVVSVEWFKGTACLSKPRDVVSGDFLWHHETPEHIFLALADCTGHGVPGALMSMLGNSLLTQIVQEHHIIEPSRVLSELDRSLEELFTHHQNSERMHDGMDICYLMLDKASLELIFSSAVLRGYILREGELLQLEGSRHPVGGHVAHTRKEFGQTTYQLRRGDRIVLSSDGYQSQFGGPRGKKLNAQHFRQLLVGSTARSAADAVSYLDAEFQLWMGAEEQIDDVLVVVLDV